MKRNSHKYQHFALDQDNNIVDIKNTVDNNKYYCHMIVIYTLLQKK